MSELLAEIDRAIDNRQFQRHNSTGDKRRNIECEIKGMRAIKAIVEKHLEGVER